MKLDSRGAKLLLKYGTPEQARNAVELADNRYNGLLDSMTWKWAEKIIVEAMENKVFSDEAQTRSQGKIKVNSYGQSSWL